MDEIVEKAVENEPKVIEPLTFKHITVGELLNTSFLQALLNIKNVKFLPLHNRTELRKMLEQFDEYLKDINEKKVELVDQYHTSVKPDGTKEVDPSVMTPKQLEAWLPAFSSFMNERLPTNLENLFRLPHSYIEIFSMADEDMIKRFCIFPKE